MKLRMRSSRLSSGVALAVPGAAPAIPRRSRAGRRRLRRFRTLLESGGPGHQVDPQGHARRALPLLRPVVELADLQMAFWPVLKFRHRMSDLPSPLKSPVPATNQRLLGIAVTVCTVDRLADRQIAFDPLDVLRQRMSD